ncbi:MAG TPA: sigma 54-interacting transcriptional regulator [Virgibacillus sp.]|nr:sigma 54-interacting transcriptional regulator [Virgibacillus sp.]HLR69153.1 sigma 54-interacting transcriptional regulator [Virgibacillus sp.]
MDIYLKDALLHIIKIIGKENNAYIDMGDLDKSGPAVLSYNGTNIRVEKEQLHELLNELFNKKVFKLDEHKSQEVKNLLQSKIFSIIINSIYDGVYITDGDGQTIKVNSAYERITGLSGDVVIGRYMGDLIDEGVIDESASLHVLKRNEQVTLMQTIKNGKNIIVSGVPIFDKTGKIQYVINSVRDITELLKLKYDNNQLLDNNLNIDRNKGEYTFNNQISKNKDMQKILKLLKKVATTNAKILFNGRTGVGKTYLAKYVHLQSKRATENFLEINCASLPPNLIESELFGYVPGAFTGAQSKGKKGLLELAHKGTLFLDEVSDLSLELQAKLLTVIENQTFFPIGSTTFKKIDVRIIAASNKNLKKLVDFGEFREDLYFRLNIVEVDVPDLKHRKEDIISLCKAFLKEYNHLYEENKHFSLEVLDALFEYEWPGNIRELRNVIENLVVTTDGNEINLCDLPSRINANIIKTNSNKPKTLKERLEIVEKQIIKETLRKHKTTRKVAEVLGVSQSTVVQKMKKWNTTD